MLVNYTNENDPFKALDVYEPFPSHLNSKKYTKNMGIEKLESRVISFSSFAPINPLSETEITANIEKTDLDSLAQVACDPNYTAKLDQYSNLTSLFDGLSEEEIIDAGSINTFSLEEIDKIIEFFKTFQSTLIDTYSVHLQRLISYVEKKSEIDKKITSLAEVICNNLTEYFQLLKRQNIEKKCIFFERIVNFYCALLKIEEREQYQNTMLFVANKISAIIKRKQNRSKKKAQDNSSSLNDKYAFSNIIIVEDFKKDRYYASTNTSINNVFTVNPSATIKNSLLDLQESIKKLTSVPNKRKIDEVDKKLLNSEIL